MGRPPIGKVAMTATERVHKFRAKHRPSKPVDAAKVAPLEVRIREPEAELARAATADAQKFFPGIYAVQTQACASGTAVDVLAEPAYVDAAKLSPDIPIVGYVLRRGPKDYAVLSASPKRYHALRDAMGAADRPPQAAIKPTGRSGGEVFSEAGRLRAEIASLKSDIIKLKAALQEEPDAAKLRKKVVDQQVEMRGLRGELKRVAKERDRYQRKTAKKFREASHHATRKSYGVIAKALHPDRTVQCSAAELKEAARLFIVLRPLFDEG